MRRSLVATGGIVVAVVALVLTLVAWTDEEAPPAGGRFLTLPPGSVLPSDEECAQRVQRNVWEPRPQNARANASPPADTSPAGTWGSPGADALQQRVTGTFTGTTDEILQWASCKWGFDTELTRAQASQESEWVQSARGDGGISYGLMQIKSTVWTGTAPRSITSSAWNVDWSLGLRRACYEGWIFGRVARGQQWGCVGAHFSGLWQDPLSRSYQERVRSRLADRPWLDLPSPAGGQPPTADRP